MPARDIFRRRFLLGAGGLTLGLPMLDIFTPRGASAQSTTPALSPFVALVVNGNGVVQSGKDILGKTDPEKFWPTMTGSLTQAGLAADRADRALGELSDHAPRLLLVKGINHPFGNNGCAHAGGDAQLLTATKPLGAGNKEQASGESIDSRIAREKNPAGREPLTLHAGRYSPGGMGFDIPGYISYVGTQQPRTPEASPYQAYTRMVGLVDVNAAQAKLIVSRRKSVNDLLRGQITSLLGRTDLSASDRQRLDQHLSAIRDLEVSFGTQLPVDKIATMKTVDADPYNMDNHETIIKLHLDLMVFAFSSGYTRVATLKIGDREDDHIYTVNGVRWNDTYHAASHRTGTDPLNRCIIADHLHAGFFKYFLDQLAAIDTPTGKLIDQGTSVWTNQVANGNHSYTNVPFILAGSASGYLKTGAFLQLAGKNTNLMLNTLLNAAGLRKPNGQPVDDFGDPSLAKGVISEMLA
jgi:hypothetical protein